MSTLCPRLSLTSTHAIMLLVALASAGCSEREAANLAAAQSSIRDMFSPASAEPVQQTGYDDHSGRPAGVMRMAATTRDDRTFQPIPWPNPSPRAAQAADESTQRATARRPSPATSPAALPDEAGEPSMPPVPPRRMSAVPAPRPAASVAPTETSPVTAERPQLPLRPTTPPRPSPAAAPVAAPVTAAPIATPVTPPVTPPAAPQAAVPTVEQVPARRPTTAPQPNSGGTTAASALERASGLLQAGQLVAARRILMDAAIGSDPAAITALAETYDPIVLAAYPKVQANAVDAARAEELYQLAISKGSTEAVQRLAALQAYRKR